ncbi:MAG TPA: VOC family protein [Acidobacteriaceae bacterium]
MTEPAIGGISPFFIVRDVAAAIAFYGQRLGFAVTYQQPDDEPFFAIVCREGAMILIKSVGEQAVPNSVRHPDARWDAYVHVADPDGLAEEYRGRGALFAVPLGDTEDGLRGFEVEDADGYVLFFGRPRLE